MEKLTVLQPYITNDPNHAKLLKLSQILYQFFSNKYTQQKNSKVIIFVNKRKDTEQICEYLQKINIFGENFVKPHKF